MVNKRNKSITVIAHELGIVPENLHRWVIELEEKEDTAFPGNGKAPDTELRYVKEERDILKKELAIFSTTKK